MLSFVNSHSNFNYYIVTIHILALIVNVEGTAAVDSFQKTKAVAYQPVIKLIIIYNVSKYFFFTICITGQSRICNNRTYS